MIFLQKYKKKFDVKGNFAIFALYFNVNKTTGMAEHNELGKWGEKLATDYLVQKGYLVCERDWKLGKRDLDIIAMTEDRKNVVFVEVKTRRNDVFAEPEEAVTSAKIRNLAIAANAYIKMEKLSQNVRFDIISIVGIPGKIVSINHIEDAFNPMLVI